MVESSVKSLSKPVFEKLEPKLGQLDDFACRQLDKVDVSSLFQGQLMDLDLYTDIDCLS